MRYVNYLLTLVKKEFQSEILADSRRSSIQIEDAPEKMVTDSELRLWWAILRRK